MTDAEGVTASRRMEFRPFLQRRAACLLLPGRAVADPPDYRTPVCAGTLGVIGDGAALGPLERQLQTETFPDIRAAIQAAMASVNRRRTRE